MYWHNHDMSGWDWFAMSVGTVLFWVLLTVAAVLLVREFNRTPRTTDLPPPAAEQLLDERFARGEIDEDEYRRRLSVLHAGDGARTDKS
ncbi:MULTISPECIES: SHOCT domain-containing protein [unclassified Streptomyces]|uniref:SHOCT domain-containing protein n=1 Tax=unclassified Streptomyces TaxID=2593676 RepID=UPI002E18AFA9|nr:MULTISPECIES: SHOCT domain-containing protein [unclassified Streptomyces]